MIAVESPTGGRVGSMLGNRQLLMVFMGVLRCNSKSLKLAAVKLPYKARRKFTQQNAQRATLTDKTQGVCRLIT